MQIVIVAAALTFPAHAFAGRYDACKQTSFIFSKLAVASLNCNFPDTEEVRRPLAAFLDTAEHFCGSGSPSSWPGTKSGGMAFYGEIKREGRKAICNRIYNELLGTIRR